MMRTWAKSLSKSEFEFARKVEKAGLASVSQAVKAIERGESERIAEWTKKLAEREIK